MQVICPNCGEKVAAENINIQNMTAVCAACDHVFTFNLPEAKIKRRKTKRPAKLSVSDNETLQMSFWTNFRLDRNEAFISSGIGGVLMTVVALILIGEPDSPAILTATFLAIGLALLYRLALTVLNQTHIEMDADAIIVRRKPIPNPFAQEHEVSLAGVTAIKCEETAASKKEGYDTPRYNVWAQVEDGTRRAIVSDITEAYAVFIAQRLEERLQQDMELDVSRLEDDIDASETSTDWAEVVRASQNGHRH